MSKIASCTTQDCASVDTANCLPVQVLKLWDMDNYLTQYANYLLVLQLCSSQLQNTVFLFINAIYFAF